MFKSILVANRGEIACRVFRTARAMGLRTIAVYSEADARAKHVREADEAVLIGPPPAAESYLRGEKILEAAKQTGAEAIHPGYGFLSENPDFAEAVIAAGLIWIGPPPSAIRAMGLKDEAKRIAEEAGVPVLAGYRGEDQSEKRLLQAAKDAGFPVLIKAVAGGGGRGIREVRSAEEFSDALASAKREAAAAFGDDRMLVEKLVQRPRHIEVQIFGDSHGNLVHLYERDCSLQRRRQKVIEEAPAPGMSDDVRKAMTDAALNVAGAVGYQNAGTVEFIVDGTGPLRADGFWFLEMNTRLQVEHPVTEAITGLDLVEWQLRVAAGEKLPLTQSQIPLKGWAMEARLCAEDPAENFRPSVGRLRRFDLAAGGARLDAGFSQGDAVSPFYDSLLAKIITHGADREAAREALVAELAMTCVTGVITNAGFLRRCAENEAFVAGNVRTSLIEENFAALTDRALSRDKAIVALGLADIFDAEQSANPWDQKSGWRLNAARPAIWRFEDAAGAVELSLRLTDDGWDARIDGRQMIVVAYGEGDYVSAQFNGALIPENIEIETAGASRIAHVGGEAFAFSRPGALVDELHMDGGDVIAAPLPGKVVALTVAPGAAVKRGEQLVTLEAMKMEHALKAPRDGVVAETPVSVGALVKEGQALVRLTPQD